MDSSQLQPEAVDDLPATDGSSRANDAATSITQSPVATRSGLIDDRAEVVTCQALRLALSAIRLHLAWHSGAMSAQAAMESLDREIAGRISRQYRVDPNQSTSVV